MPYAKTSVLVVEDDSSLRDLYKKILILAGFAVSAVGDGIDALRRISGEPPDALVLDLALPRMSGRDVQREMAARADTARIPIVVVTGTDASDLEDGTVAQVLRKPVEASDLIFAVNNALRRAAQSRSH